MKKRKRIIVFGFIMLATAFIVALSVNMGIKISEYLLDDKLNINNKEVLKTEEQTDDFKIEFKEEAYILKDKDGNIIVESKRVIPSIKSDKYQGQADKITSFLLNVSNENWEQIKSSSDEYFSQELKDKVGVNYLLSALEQNEKYFTFVFDMSGSMGVVSWNDRAGYSFDTQTGELLNINDITNNLDELTSTCYSKLYEYLLGQDYIEDLDENWQTKLNSLMLENGVWYLTKDGLSFSFPKYSLGPGYIDIISYTIGYDDLNDLILQEYQNIS